MKSQDERIGSSVSRPAKGKRHTTCDDDRGHQARDISMSNAGTRVLTFDTAVIQPDVESNIRGALPPVTIRDASSFGAGGEDIALKRWNHLTALTFAKLVTLLLALANVGYLWGYSFDKSNGEMCSLSASDKCVSSLVSKMLISVARFTAGALFSTIAFSMLSKYYATRYFLHHSWISLIVDWEPTHKLHTYFGLATLIFSAVHGLAHIARAAYEENLYDLYAENVNRSGLVALVLLLPIVLPMSLSYVKEQVTFERRKVIHLLFVPLLIAICFHTSALKTFAGVLLVWYVADRLYFTTRMTFAISRPKFKAIGRGTLVKMDLPSGYIFKPGSYVQVNCPAISASEWHPFSIFPVPGPSGRSGARAGFHVEAVGDWTSKLFRLSLENPRMPLWITAAQPSVLESIVYFDNVILVCTGAGITPAVSVVDRFARKKNMHILWMSREAGMIAMFEKQLRLVESTVGLTGSPSTSTRRRVMDLLAPAVKKSVARRHKASESAAKRPRGASTASSSRSRSPRLTSGLTQRGSGMDEWLSRRKQEGKPSASDAEEDVASVVGRRRDGRSRTRARSTPGDRASQARRVEKQPRYRGRASKVAARSKPSGKIDQSQPKQTEAPRVAQDYPVSLIFGRPDVEKFIKGIVLQKATIAEGTVADAKHPMRPATGSEDLRRSRSPGRLSGGQRVSKRHLMSADLSVITESITPKRSTRRARGEKASKRKKQWLVLYCGANAHVERAVVAACVGLDVTFRKEYFDAW